MKTMIAQYAIVLILLTARKRITQAVVKDEIVEFDEIFYLCPAGEADDNTFVPAGLMDENLLRARDAYRRKKGLLSSEEIASLSHQSQSNTRTSSPSSMLSPQRTFASLPVA